MAVNERACVCVRARARARACVSACVCVGMITSACCSLMIGR